TALFCSLLSLLNSLFFRPQAEKIGATGFEPATSCSQSTRSSQAELRPVMESSHESYHRIARSCTEVARDEATGANPIQSAFTKRNAPLYETNAAAGEFIPLASRATPSDRSLHLFHAAKFPWARKRSAPVFPGNNAVGWLARPIPKKP